MVGPKPALLNAGAATEPLRSASFVGRFTLITGDVKRGKTRLTQRILEACCRDFPGPFTVIDLAPDLEHLGRRGRIDGLPVGGALIGPANCRIHYHRVGLAAPRLQGVDEQERQLLARDNRGRIERLFASAFTAPVGTLFINDCSLYLQAGSAAALLGRIRSAATAVVNGYYGRILGPGRLSDRERRGMDELMAHCDQWIQL